MTTTSSAEKSAVKTVTNPRVDREVREKIVTARIGLLLKQPFFGNLATRMTLVNGDEWLGTAATDGRTLYYNSEFFKDLNVKEIEFVIGHEILHVCYDHFGRREHRDPRLYNCAADYCVNADLIESKIGQRPRKTPGLYDKKYQGWSSEEIYDHLYANAEKINIQDLVDQLLDEHMDGDDDGDEGEGEGNGRPRLTKEQRDAIKDEIKDAMIQAAQAAGAGNLPKGIGRLIRDFTEPKMNWRELLPQQIQSTIKNDYSFMRPNRKGWHGDAIMAGLLPEETIDVCVTIDASGSMNDKMLRDIMGEIKGIMEQYAEFRVQVWSFDTEVYNHQVFTNDNLDDIVDYQVQGGGGTSFDVNWTWMKENNIEPKLLVFFTDMMTGDGWGDENYCQTLWIAHSGGERIEAPWGLTVPYTEPKK
jgi:predicted metal-dependent peptidase